MIFNNISLDIILLFYYFIISLFYYFIISLFYYFVLIFGYSKGCE